MARGRTRAIRCSAGEGSFERADDADSPREDVKARDCHKDQRFEDVPPGDRNGIRSAMASSGVVRRPMPCGG